RQQGDAEGPRPHNGAQAQEVSRIGEAVHCVCQPRHVTEYAPPSITNDRNVSGSEMSVANLGRCSDLLVLKPCPIVRCCLGEDIDRGTLLGNSDCFDREGSDQPMQPVTLSPHGSDLATEATINSATSRILSFAASTSSRQCAVAAAQSSTAATSVPEL